MNRVLEHYRSCGLVRLVLIALSEADLAVRMHDTGRPGMYRFYMLAALAQAGLAGAWLIIGLNGGYAQTQTTWRNWGLVALIWIPQLLARKTSDRPGRDPKQGKES